MSSPTLSEYTTVEPSVDFRLFGISMIEPKVITKNALKHGAIAMVFGVGAGSAVSGSTNIAERQTFIKDYISAYNNNPSNSSPNHVAFLGAYTGVVEKVPDKIDLSEFPFEIKMDIDYEVKATKVLDISGELEIIKKATPNYHYYSEDVLGEDLVYEAKPRRFFEI